jgi:hypothetical protein
MLLDFARKLPIISTSTTSLLSSLHNVDFSDVVPLQSMPLLATASEAVGLLHGARPDIPDWFVWTVIFVISYFAQQKFLRFLARW